MLTRKEFSKRRTMSKADILALVRIQDRLSAIRQKYEENDYECVGDSGNTASQAIDCAIANLECILQDFY